MKCEPIDIKCPNCGALAKFEEPFEFLSIREKKANREDNRSSHLWGGWVVIERFPSQIGWKAPSSSSQYLRGGGGTEVDGYPLLTNGLIQCSGCHSNQKHRLSWPQDAYWQWEIRGEVLWAWDRNHACEILNYVRSELRPSRRPYRLRYVPEHFLSAKVRPHIASKLAQSLSA
jgi:hypothetical protein